MNDQIICGFGCGCDHDPARLCKVEVMAGRDVQAIIQQHVPWTSVLNGRDYCGACWNDEGGPREWPCDVAIVAAHLSPSEAHR